MAVLVVMEIVLPVMGIFAGPGGWEGTKTSWEALRAGCEGFRVS